jgi:hypothetical protein
VTSFRTISVHGEWEGLGETITQITSRLFTGGATVRRDRAGVRATVKGNIRRLKLAAKTDFFG